MVEVSLTVGKLDASLALLLTKDHHLIEFPTILLPNGVKAGSIVKIKCEQDFDTEQQEAKQFKSIQDEILNTFGKNLPVNPVLKIKNITQTSCVLEWDELNLGTSSLKNLFLFKDGKKLGSIPQPLVNRTTKLSGLPIDKTFEFQLKLDTTAGIYESEILEVTTHKMTDLSGINICLGDISANEVFTVQDIEDTLKNMGAHYPSQLKVSVDTTHFICTRENKSNPEFIKASDMNIPIIRPEWLKACEKDKRIVGVRDYYTKDCVLPDILAKDFWHKNKSLSTPIATPVNDNDKPVPELPVEESVGHAVPTINEPVDTVPEQSAVVENAELEADTEAEPVGDSTDAIPISSDKIPAKDEVAPEIHEIKIDEPEDANPLEVEAPTDTPQPASTILETQPEPEHQPQLSQDEAPEPKVVDENDKEPKETLHEINLDTPTEPEPVSDQPKVETTGGNSEEKEDVTEEADAEGEAEGEGEETDKETDKVDKPTSKKSKKKKNKKKKN